MRLTRRGKRTGAALAAVLVASALLAAFAWRGSPITKPDDPCASPPVLQTVDGVTLQPNAMKAFTEAERLAGRSIQVVQSYRSCSQQAIACQNICGSGEGCPGTCVKPGRSYHQLGAAVDVSARALRTRGVIAALEKAGWCQSVPATDPGHFSFGGCH